MTYKTEQEQFWADDFGSNYISRNSDAHKISSNIALFSKILEKTRHVKSVIEFGANIGLNLMAIKTLLPDIEMSAVEINKKAALELKKILPEDHIYNQSILDMLTNIKNTPVNVDFVLTKGVLIHINPDELQQTYEILYTSSRRYICIVEYFNTTTVSIPYRGHQDRLFKRDFAGELMQKYSDIHLVDYGFTYHGDPNFPQDDTTWFLFEKNN